MLKPAQTTFIVFSSVYFLPPRLECLNFQSKTFPIQNFKSLVQKHIPFHNPFKLSPSFISRIPFQKPCSETYPFPQSFQTFSVVHQPDSVSKALFRNISLYTILSNFLRRSSAGFRFKSSAREHIPFHNPFKLSPSSISRIPFQKLCPGTYPFPQSFQTFSVVHQPDSISKALFRNISLYTILSNFLRRSSAGFRFKVIALFSCFQKSFLPFFQNMNFCKMLF